MEENEYKDNEKVLYKTKGALRLPHKEPEEVDCFITENHVVIDAQEPVKIPVSLVKDCHIADYYPTLVRDAATGLVQDAATGTVTLRYQDNSGRNQKAKLEVTVYDATMLRNAFESARMAPKREGIRLRWMDAWSREIPSAMQPSTKGLVGPLCTDLCSVGLDARIAERGQIQEQIDGDWEGMSEGLIEIRHSPIRLVNLLRKVTFTYQGISREAYKAVYLVPDSTIPWNCYEPIIHGYRRSVRIRSIPLFGRIVDVRWEGTFESGILTRLSQDTLLNQTLVRLRQDIEIVSYPEYGCWTISPPSLWDAVRTPKRLTAPPREQWDCYERIARHLLGQNTK